jgi:hypothetical protein
MTASASLENRRAAAQMPLAFFCSPQTRLVKNQTERDANGISLLRSSVRENQDEANDARTWMLHASLPAPIRVFFVCAFRACVVADL